jgi:hypothetical protein
MRISPLQVCAVVEMIHNSLFVSPVYHSILRYVPWHNDGEDAGISPVDPYVHTLPYADRMLTRISFNFPRIVFTSEVESFKVFALPTAVFGDCDPFVYLIFRFSFLAGNHHLEALDSSPATGGLARRT